MLSSRLKMPDRPVYRVFPDFKWVDRLEWVAVPSNERTQIPVKYWLLHTGTGTIDTMAERILLTIIEQVVRGVT